jgi:hypothetical protein
MENLMMMMMMMKKKKKKKKLDIIRTWESIRENMKVSAIVCLGYYDLKQQEPWFNE